MIEWNDDDVATLVSAEPSPDPARRTGTVRTIGMVVGALGALMLAAWGLRRLRAV